MYKAEWSTFLRCHAEFNPLPTIDFISSPFLHTPSLFHARCPHAESRNLPPHAPALPRGSSNNLGIYLYDGRLREPPFAQQRDFTGVNLLKFIRMSPASKVTGYVKETSTSVPSSSQPRGCRVAFCTSTRFECTCKYSSRRDTESGRMKIYLSRVSYAAFHFLLQIHQR